MVHVPVENIMSKWYGESEKKLSAIFDACDEMGGAIIFIDEVDALAGSRSTGGMHEATRRVLSVILQKVGARVGAACHCSCWRRWCLSRGRPHDQGVLSVRGDNACVHEGLWFPTCCAHRTLLFSPCFSSTGGRVRERFEEHLDLRH